MWELDREEKESRIHPIKSPKTRLFHPTQNFSSSLLNHKLTLDITCYNNLRGYGPLPPSRSAPDSNTATMIESDHVDELVASPKILYGHTNPVIPLSHQNQTNLSVSLTIMLSSRERRRWEPPSLPLAYIDVWCPWCTVWGRSLESVGRVGGSYWACKILEPRGFLARVRRMLLGTLHRG